MLNLNQVGAGLFWFGSPTGQRMMPAFSQRAFPSARIPNSQSTPYCCNDTAMPPRFNPFRQWLGVDSTNPNHYELLECDRTASLDEIRRSAQRQLDKLKEVDPGDRVELLKKMTRRVKLAYQVLSDPEKRRAYDTKIDDSANKSLPAASETAIFSQTGIHHADATSTDLPLPLPSGIHEAGDAAIANPVSGDGDEDIPMAVPITAPEEKPIDGEDAPLITESPAPAIKTKKAVPSIDLTGGHSYGDNATPTLDPIAVKPTRRRRPTWVVPVVMVAVFGIGVAGLVYFFLKYPSGVGGGANSNSTTGQQRDDEDTANEQLPENTERDEMPGPLDPIAVEPAEGTGEANETEDADESEGMDGAAETFEDAQNADSGEAEPSDADSGDGIDNAAMEGGGAESDETNREDEPQPEVIAAPLNGGTRFLAGAFVERARQAIFDRDYQRARSLADQIRAMIQADENTPVDDERARWIAYADSIEEVTRRLEQFWDQVRKSAIENDGDISFNDTRIAIVEADQNRVMVRVGENREYRYEELPAGLAMAIGESGEKENLPDWYIQKAAFYAANLRLDLKYRDRVREFMELARKDGYDVAFLDAYMDAERVSALEQLADRNPISQDELEESVQDLAGQLAVPQPLSRLSQAEIVQKMGEVYEWVLGQPELSTASAAASAVWLSRMAAQMPDSEAATNFNSIAASLARTDVARDQFEMLQTMLGRNPSGDELERILRKALGYLRSPLSAALRSRERREFVNQLRRAAEQVDSEEIRRQIESFER